ncbi:HAD family hydrolase [Basilea psittacipulmonis]|uniref:Phosphoserine phosphatase n=1 Tax=Basilea psittacipulmonis DSM 24701 TaxID=1072685 RepID=A0A077DDV9_9BURK|nr:HAD family hydrolase [Basilea psittacipulmonis]AIL32804.1 phosphoserine phosphatase [Basilea psittacipulmonis DSM 24701]
MKKPIVAIAYDFDGTLAPGNMQEHNFIPELNITAQEFWQQSNALAQKNKADGILSYMYWMLKKAEEAEVRVRKQDFLKYGSEIRFYPGVEDWFQRLNEYAKERGLELRHYIISSGLREMIEGTSIAPYIHKIYASGYLYDIYDVAMWPATAVNYTTKTQFLFRINKGCEDESDVQKINEYVPQNERPVPFFNMIFIGDGETDVPCMRLVKESGGHSIAVYANNEKAASAEKLIREGRVHVALESNYEENKPLDLAIKSIIDGIHAHYRLLETQTLD